MPATKNLLISPGVIRGNEIRRVTNAVFLWMQLKDWARHAMIAGTTGGGKTMLILKIIQQIIKRSSGEDGAGCTFISPHPGARLAILAFCAANDIDPDRIVDVKPGDPRCGVSIDPFAGYPDSADL